MLAALMKKSALGLVVVSLFASCRCADPVALDGGVEAGSPVDAGSGGGGGAGGGTGGGGTAGAGGGGGVGGMDAGGMDAGGVDAGLDAGSDAGATDAGGPVDGGGVCVLDAGAPRGLLFIANDGLTGDELWFTDGTTTGTVRLTDINPGTASSIEDSLPLGRLALMNADEPDGGAELWSSDGTAQGTRQVADINPGAERSQPRQLTVEGCRMFFAANDGDAGNELWVSDGTRQGTRLVRDIHPTGSSNPIYLAALDGRVLFRANDGTNGEELWSSDGTSAGTQLVVDLRPGPASSSPDALKAAAGRVWFTTSQGPYVSDGTASGTYLLGRQTFDGGLRSAFNIVFHAGRVFFNGNDGDAGSELWEADPTGERVRLVADLNPMGSSNVSQLASIGGRLFFSATDDLGAEPRVLQPDGGVELLGDLQPGPTGSFPNGFVQVGDAVFFSAAGPDGSELWRTDGTAAGTARFQDIHPTAGSGPSWLTAWAGALFFTADDGMNGREPWVLAADAGAAVMLKNVNTTSASAGSSPRNLRRF